MDSIFEKEDKDRGEGGYPVKIPQIWQLKYPAAVLAILLFLFSTHKAASEVVDRIVAVVNDTIITLSEVNAATAVAIKGLKRDVKAGENIVETKSKVLDALIEKKLMKQAADKTGIEVSEKEIDNAIEDIKMQNNITEKELLSALEQNGLTYREYREQMREDIRQAKFVSREFRARVAIEHEEVEDYYKRNIENFRAPDFFKIRLIFLTRADEKNMRTRLQAVMEELENGVDFKEVARQYSDGPAASEGGELGYVEAGELEGAIQGAARQLTEGELSGPVFTENGINIIQLIDRREGEPRPLEDVKEEITNLLFQQKMAERYNLWLEDMKRIAHIEVRL
jgi:peptidyl-prolyl cis-trans isomerase SurA